MPTGDERMAKALAGFDASAALRLAADAADLHKALAGFDAAAALREAAAADNMRKALSGFDPSAALREATNAADVRKALARFDPSRPLREGVAAADMRKAFAGFDTAAMLRDSAADAADLRKALTGFDPAAALANEFPDLSEMREALLKIDPDFALRAAVATIPRDSNLRQSLAEVRAPSAEAEIQVGPPGRDSDAVGSSVFILFLLAYALASHQIDGLALDAAHSVPTALAALHVALAQHPTASGGLDLLGFLGVIGFLIRAAVGPKVD
jgi:hypothetical protein